MDPVKVELYAKAEYRATYADGTQKVLADLDPTPGIQDDEFDLVVELNAKNFASQPNPKKPGNTLTPEDMAEASMAKCVRAIQAIHNRTKIEDSADYSKGQADVEKNRAKRGIREDRRRQRKHRGNRR